MTNDIAAEPAPGYSAMRVLNPSNSRGLASHTNIILNHSDCDPGFNPIEFDGFKIGTNRLFVAHAIAERCRIMVPQGSAVPATLCRVAVWK